MDRNPSVSAKLGQRLDLALLERESTAFRNRGNVHHGQRAVALRRFWTHKLSGHSLRNDQRNG
jgi:hypothetical protein